MVRHRDAQPALLDESAPQYTGRFRDEQVWIGGGSISPHAAQFVPPHHDRVPALMEDLVEFCARTDIPALAHAAIAHAQFETIHPFPDGNGRTGRALIHSLLRRSGLARNISVPVSAGLRLKDFLLRQPVVTAKLVASELGTTPVSAQNAIDTLVAGGALQQTNAWKRNRIWHAPEVLDALDHFGSRARRR